MVCSCLILPVLANPVEGILGDLSKNPLQRFYKPETKKRGYLECRWIMSPSRRWGILFVAESSNVAQEPTHGQRNRWSGPLPEGRSLDDWMLKQRHLD